MSKARAIYIAVLAYTFLELIILMSLTQPAFPAWSEEQWSHSRVYSAFCFTQLALIPAAAALFSYLQRWPKNSVKGASITLLVGTLILPLALLPLIAVVLFFGFLRIDPSPSAAAALILVFALELLWSVRWVRKLRRRSVQQETERWLAERHSGLSLHEIHSRTRAIRWSICIPSVTVLFLFLFFLELWGACSHVLTAKASIPGYNVPIPITWYLTPSSWNQQKQISGFIAKGPARAFREYPFFPLGSWSIQPDISDPSRDQALDTAWLSYMKVTNQTNIPSAVGTFTCLEAKPNYPLHFTSYAVEVHCSSPGKLQSTFAGDRGNLAGFYAMLSKIRPSTR